jgi:predicted LPLAT superfamily acyltransferase/glycosyltransferase involved in cell wall biosynthesis
MVLRILVCIPTYNNAGTIEQVVLDALNTTSYTVLVVDDGSDVPVRSLLQENERVHVVRLEQNSGKGFALQTAFRWAVGKGFTHLLSVDGDGQHLLHDSSQLLEKALEHPWSLIVGQRRFETASDVPGISKFGRKFSNFWVQYQTGKVIRDSQSGYRLYPLFHVQNLKFWTKRYDFEIEVLIRLLWKGVSVEEVEIDVFYPPADKRVSHFNKFWDNVRISTLNTLLVVVSLLKFDRDPGKNALAIGLGLFIGCTPFFGFHALIAAGLAFGLRLNAVLMFIGTNISIPPIAALVVPLEIAVGRYFIPNHSLLAWGLGSLIVGIFVGTAGGLITWIAGHKAPAKKKTNWTGKTRGGKFGNGFLKMMIRWFGVRTAYLFLFTVVPYFYLFAPTARKSANEYWSIIRPEKNWWQRQGLVLLQLYRFGQVLMDRGLQSFHETPQFETRPHGMNQILEPMRAKQPLILMSGHVGSWDLAAAFLNTNGFWGQFHMVHYQSKDLTFEKVVQKKNAPSHVNSLLTNDDAVLKVKQMLEQGEPVGMMGDRAMSTHVELVPFLGRLAPFDRRPFRIGATCRARMLFTFGFKGKGKCYDLYAQPSFEIEYSKDQSRDVQLRSHVQDYAKALETFLAKYPEQWFNFYPFFSREPEAPPGVQVGIERNSLWQEWHKPATTEFASAPATKANVEAGSPQ